MVPEHGVGWLQARLAPGQGQERATRARTPLGEQQRWTRGRFSSNSPHRMLLGLRRELDGAAPPRAVAIKAGVRSNVPNAGTWYLCSQHRSDL